eukprot:TRINITY_DN2833_c0_g1_i6.p1 TRINITY_DN2833_c0_g1~~TRINITY_DN2833_c0_g1_i6.p1  ORF type:complete len:270 (-),score=44.55 TRINITY_DN2833_c0_g1_i6:159-968(-)
MSDSFHHHEQKKRNGSHIVVVEPFFGGSHKVLVDLLHRELEIPSENIITMTPKKWHWRIRTSAVTIASMIPTSPNLKVLFVTSMINLAELIGIRPDLAHLDKVLYFHENQIVYPVRKHEDTDFQLGWIQFISCLAADTVLFNSSYNMSSFIEGLVTFLNHMPDYRPKDQIATIRAKSRVLHFPICFTPVHREASSLQGISNEKPLHIVWPHRWEHDKNPQLLFDVLFSLLESHVRFLVSILGLSLRSLSRFFMEHSVDHNTSVNPMLFL